jgi:tRNA-splicing endonuclease subunit Sen2
MCELSPNDRVSEITSEEVTAKRRAERKQFKSDRARAIATAAAEAEAAFVEGRTIPAEETRASIPSAATWKPSSSTQNAPSSPPPEPIQMAPDPDAEPLEDLEHMQLTLPEAFFLTWALGCLNVHHLKTVRTRICSAGPENVNTPTSPSSSQCHYARSG